MIYIVVEENKDIKDFDFSTLFGIKKETKQFVFLDVYDMYYANPKFTFYKHERRILKNKFKNIRYSETPFKIISNSFNSHYVFEDQSIQTDIDYTKIINYIVIKFYTSEYLKLNRKDNIQAYRYTLHTIVYNLLIGFSGAERFNQMNESKHKFLWTSFKKALDEAKNNCYFFSYEYLLNQMKP